jgi:hypothetical protein
MSGWARGGGRVRVVAWRAVSENCAPRSGPCFGSPDLRASRIAPRVTTMSVRSSGHRVEPAPRLRMCRCLRRVMRPMAITARRGRQQDTRLAQAVLKAGVLVHTEEPASRRSIESGPRTHQSDRSRDPTESIDTELRSADPGVGCRIQALYGRKQQPPSLGNPGVLCVVSRGASGQQFDELLSRAWWSSTHGAACRSDRWSSQTIVRSDDVGTAPPRPAPAAESRPVWGRRGSCRR